jgi:hypothetical protein
MRVSSEELAVRNNGLVDGARRLGFLVQGKGSCE